MLVIRWANIIDFSGGLIAKKKPRAHQRINLRNLVRYGAVTENFPELVSNLVNISEGGLQFSIRSKLPKGTLLNMIINLVEKDQDVPVVAKVCWSKPVIGYSHAYKVGVCFQEILPEHQYLIHGLVGSKPVLLL